jgi:NADPH:quinone reductase-like Zn-dependent oxidoreductase
VQLGDGTRCYLTGPPAPYGTLAELVPVPDSAGFPVPAGIDPGLAAALRVAGLAAWVALDHRGHLQPGETVLVLGAGGSAGQLAVQSARILGAGRVVGAARGQALEQAADRGADAVVDLADDQAIDADLAAAAPGGYDVIVDFLRDGLAPYAMNHANVGARYIQVGSSAGPRPRSPRPPSATSCLRSWVTPCPARPPRCAVPPTRNWCITPSTGSSPWTRSKHIACSQRPLNPSRLAEPM